MDIYNRDYKYPSQKFPALEKIVLPLPLLEKNPSNIGKNRFFLIVIIHIPHSDLRMSAVGREGITVTRIKHFPKCRYLPHNQSVKGLKRTVGNLTFHSFYLNRGSSKIRDQSL